MTPREVEKILLKDGWYFVKQAGSHRHFKHPVKPGKITVPQHKKPKDVDPAILKSIFKHAGLK